MSGESNRYLHEYQAAQRYLRLSRAYAEHLGGLRWSSSEDALVLADGRLFAFTEGIAEFVDGFASQGPEIPFGYLLHWMDLVQNCRSLPVQAVQRLSAAFKETGSQWRFAGAFAATLTSGIPEVPDPPNFDQIGQWLRNRAFPIRWFTAQFHEAPTEHGAPVVAPSAFEGQVLAALDAYSDDELRTWLRTGRGPIHEGERLADELPQPRTFTRIAETLLQRPRLAGAQTYVTQLVGALTLPPRRFMPEELPVGGYTDIVTQGKVEHLLPTQFALDEFEFLRRYAERELLYFRREEPPVQNREELIVLLDQGVRTWGDVRLVLAAGMLAFGKNASARELPFLVATTGNGGKIIDPLQAEDAELGEMLEASDLSLHPGLALERVLESPSEMQRDVVLLTHPRGLRESDVLNAARRLPPHDRLFGVTLDQRGNAEVSEVRRGTPIRVRQFHVDFAPSLPKARPAAGVSGPWTGDVETIPFPFRLGTEPTIAHFDLDHDNQWLLTASGAGILHLWRMDGSPQEMLPRSRGDNVLTQVIGVLGVSGGFVVAGMTANQDATAVEPTSYEVLFEGFDPARKIPTIKAIREITGWGLKESKDFVEGTTPSSVKDGLNKQDASDIERQLIDGGAWVHITPNNHFLTLTHYDVVRRRCTRYAFGRWHTRAIEIRYAPDSHRVVVLARSGKLEGAVDLLTGRREERHPGEAESGSLLQGMSSVCNHRDIATFGPMANRPRCVIQDYSTGQLRLFRDPGDPILMLPMSDGRPCFANGSINRAQLAGSTLALHAQRRDIGQCITLVRVPDGAALREYAIKADRTQIVRHLLSADGSQIALLRADQRVEVEAVHAPAGPAICTRVGGFNTQPRLFVGRRFLIVNLGASKQFWHLLEWTDGTLSHTYERERTPSQCEVGRRSLQADAAMPIREKWPACCHEDPERYIAAIKKGSLWFVLDRFGQVAILNRREHIVAMCMAFRDRFAVWAPGEVRWGSSTLQVGAVTENAAATIGQALLDAETMT